jgi:Tol biopolymer transport system component
MVTGSRAFQGDTRASTLAAVLKDEPTPPSQIAVGLPRDVERLIRRCLQKDPARRFQHMDDLKVALEELKEESDSGALAAATAPMQTRRWRWWLSVGIACTVLLAALVAWLWLRPAEPPRGDPTAAPLTTYSGVETQPSFSPDGTEVAFVWNGEKEDSPNIYVKQIGSAGPPTPLTKDAAGKSYPAWSPDDRSIAFTRSQPDKGNVAIVVITSRGGSERTLAELIDVAGLGWTPDGKWVVLGGRDSAQDYFGIGAIAIDTGERRQLTTVVATAPAGSGGWGDAFPSVSPDGRTLAFARHEAGYVSDLYVLPLTKDLQPDGEPRKLTSQYYGSVSGLAWTADSREIVYAGGGHQTQSLYRVSVAGQQAPTRLTYVTPEAIFPAIAARTSRLAYSWRIYNVNLWRLDTRTGEHTVLISSTWDSRIPQYSPDGRKIAFQSNRSGSVEVWTCDADGSNCQQLTSFGGPQCGTPRWSPDSRWLALDARVEGSSEIYVMAADGGTPNRVTTPVEGVNNAIPSWSRDGAWIYYQSSRRGRREIWKLPVAGGKPVVGVQAEQVTHSGGAAPQVSFDGQHLYYVKEGQVTRLFRMPVEGGEEQQVVPGGFAGWAGFGVTAKGVYFQTDLTIKFLDAATGKLSTVAVLPTTGGSGGICVSPDDRYVVYTKLDRNTTDLMLVENFR